MSDQGKDSTNQVGLDDLKNLLQRAFTKAHDVIDTMIVLEDRLDLEGLRPLMSEDNFTALSHYLTSSLPRNKGYIDGFSEFDLETRKLSKKADPVLLTRFLDSFNNADTDKIQNYYDGYLGSLAYLQSTHKALKAIEGITTAQEAEDLLDAVSSATRHSEIVINAFADLSAGPQ